MKTVFQLLMTLFLVAGSIQLSSAANILPIEEGTPLLLRAKSSSPDELLVQLINLQQSPTTLILKDQFGETYLQHKIKNHNGYLLNMRMSEVPEGRYFLYAMQDEKEAVVVLYKHSDTILVSEMSR